MYSKYIKIYNIRILKGSKPTATLFPCYLQTILSHKMQLFHNNQKSQLFVSSRLSKICSVGKQLHHSGMPVRVRNNSVLRHKSFEHKTDREQALGQWLLHVRKNPA
jgi:hypothetical protein